MSMESKVVRVTPVVAREWLKRNTTNRPLRQTVVEGLQLAFQRGEYQLTHQGVAFDRAGVLVDGQHRLTAIASMPESFAVEMMVTRGLEQDAFNKIDIGLKRTPSDLLHVPQGHAACARFMATLIETARAGITPQLLVPYVHGIADAYGRLIEYAPTITKTWSSAAIRSAAILRMMGGGDNDYVLLSYHALNHAEFDSMSPVVQALYRQHGRGMIRPGGLDIFSRAYRAFDAKRQMTATIQISDQSNIIEEAREVISSTVLGQKKAAMKAAKSVVRMNSKASA